MVSISASTPVSTDLSVPIASRTRLIAPSDVNFVETGKGDVRYHPRNSPCLKLKASKMPLELIQEVKSDNSDGMGEMLSGSDVFDDLKSRFLAFKKFEYMDKLEHFQNLSKAQAPKFLVIACVDSRVCPSCILGFQPGEAAMVRNIANLVPRYETGPSETKAALEFAVNSLNVQNILVIGHSCCGGIRALMSMEDKADSGGSSFIKDWVVTGEKAKAHTKAIASDLNFDQQCRHCEKESINCSLLNLVTYPWIEEKLRKGLLSVHGGYYDFVDCTFEKWTLGYETSNGPGHKFMIKDRLFWS